MYGNETGPKADKGEDGMSNRTRQNNKRADRNMESNDNPEILDRGETSEEAGLPSGHNNNNNNNTRTLFYSDISP